MRLNTTLGGPSPAERGDFQGRRGGSGARDIRLAYSSSPKQNEVERIDSATNPPEGGEQQRYNPPEHW